MTAPDLAFTCVLGLAAILATILVGHARSDARRYVQFAAALYCALALADFAAILNSGAPVSRAGEAVTLMVLSLAPVALALAFASSFEGPVPEAVALLGLVLGCFAGIAAAMTGAGFIAMAVLFASVCAILAMAVRRARAAPGSSLQASLAGLALVAGAAAYMTAGLEAQTTLALFSAVAILGTALACGKRSHRAVEQPRLPTGNVVAFIRRDR